MKQTLLKTILFGVTHILRRTAKKYPSFRKEMKRRNCVVQIKLKDGSIGRHYTFQRGTVKSQAGIHPNPDVKLIFKDLPTALSFLKPGADQAEILNAAKNFRVMVVGRDELCVWFMQMMNQLQTVGLELGTKMPDGTVRYTTNTNGGPMFVYVKDGRIVRMTPIVLDETDAPSWSIQARGKTFTPWRKSTLSPHASALKSMVYSDKRLLYPMKRVDFDPDGERNPQNRGISGYERISWDEALDTVASEIKRMKKEHGPGAIAIPMPSHHQWGNIGYYLSALLRFGNLIGFTRVHPNPDSWEGWYWGAMHHFGGSLRLGVPSFYGTVEDCLQEAQQIVFWSSDPESTNGLYAGFEGTQRRLWAKELGIEFVHIDPHLNPTAQLLGGKWISIRPATDAALATAIMHVWVAEGLYDKQYVADRSTGFDEWRDYLLGSTDGVPKTPEWQEGETGVPAHVCRALARSWGSKKTYLSAGGLGAGWGGACRSATGSQWARCMILMMAMQGWGKPGINFGNLQFGAPLDYEFYFPGYAEGGISGELAFTASGINNYQRMPHLITMNPVKQMIPRQRLPEAIVEGHSKGFMWDGSSMEAQFAPFEYPMPGYSKIHMLYRYGGSSFGTIAKSTRFEQSYRHPSIEFVVNQSIWFEGDAKYADIILPACTSFERWDISEWANCAGYIHHNNAQLNHRIVTLQHKAIEPLGESKSDYQIYLEILHRLGLGAMFSEGCSELDWCKRVFDSTDLPKYIGWKEFVKKGYYVLPAEPEKTRTAVSMRWYAEGRPKDIPEPHPLPSQFTEEFGKGLETQSGKLEFVSSSLLRGQADNPERPALNRYIPAWEGPHAKELFEKYPLQMISTHPRYSFHTYGDGKDSVLNDIDDHRIFIDGYYYWVMKINPEDAAKRGIRHHQPIRVFNDRGSVIFVADVSPLVGRGLMKTFESNADFDPVHTHGTDGVSDRSGCANVLTSPRPQQQGTEGMAANSCLVEMQPWTPPAGLKSHVQIKGMPPSNERPAAAAKAA
ncbi:molybdopterin-dependent oxidoreductase [Pollutimonas bauzanensis]|uniref:Trimethylamine-N-oxide reductase (Cytochrome c) n=1 Tax=Pollutimonas bauzanensis TaxID=658167 RepID=A0A1M5QGZ1_9BURK|nr:molybdopterin-dependent oxidoreductase [Pollutimonas bauzanensis]SHH13141.1 trimethylamine-N-oxide reductase (cytochrome c) [Pollutimonas bauzanensis]